MYSTKCVTHLNLQEYVGHHLYVVICEIKAKLKIKRLINYYKNPV